MKKYLLSLFAIFAGIGTLQAVSNNTVEIKYNGNTATVTIASNIAS